MVKYDLIQIEQRYTQLVDKLLNCRTITSVGITCNKSVELDNLVASCQQAVDNFSTKAGNKQSERLMLKIPESADNRKHHHALN